MSDFDIWMQRFIGKLRQPCGITPAQQRKLAERLEVHVATIPNADYIDKLEAQRARWAAVAAANTAARRAT